MKSRRYLAIDVGNTSIKVGEFAIDLSPPASRRQRVCRISSLDPDWLALQSWIHPDVSAAFVVSVCQPAADQLAAWLTGQRPGCTWRQLGRADFPLTVRVEHPDRVGHDRLAAAVAATQLKRANRAAIVVDAGSAITVDLVSPAGEFLGGAILPGWQTMARSLAAETQLLPHIDSSALDVPPEVVGRSTEKAIASGLYWGAVGAVRELMKRMSAGWNLPPDRLLAGGDMQGLAKHLGQRVRCIPDLVLRGIQHAVQEMQRRDDRQ